MIQHLQFFLWNANTENPSISRFCSYSISKIKMTHKSWILVPKKKYLHLVSYSYLFKHFVMLFLQTSIKFIATNEQNVKWKKNKCFFYQIKVWLVLASYFTSLICLYHCHAWLKNAPGNAFVVVKWKWKTLPLHSSMKVGLRRISRTSILSSFPQMNVSVKILQSRHVHVTDKT